MDNPHSASRWIIRLQAMGTVIQWARGVGRIGSICHPMYAPRIGRGCGKDCRPDRAARSCPAVSKISGGGSFDRPTGDHTDRPSAGVGRVLWLKQ